MEKDLKNVADTSEVVQQESVSEGTRGTSSLLSFIRSGSQPVIGDPLLQVYNDDQEMPWDDFRKLPFIALLSHIQNLSPKKLFLGPCDSSVYVEEIRSLFSKSEIHCLAKESVTIPHIPLQHMIRGNLEGFLPVEAYDLMVIPHRLPIVRDKDRLFARLKRGFAPGGSLAFCLPVHLDQNLLQPAIELLKHPKWEALFPLERMQELYKITPSYIEQQFASFKIKKIQVIERKFSFIGYGMKRLLQKWGMLGFLERNFSNEVAPLTNRFWLQYNKMMQERYKDPKYPKKIHLSLKWMLCVIEKP